MEEKRFSETDLSKIDKANDLHIAPLREDGETYGTPTWIWEVVVDGHLYVRAYNGVNSRWYKAAMSQRAGRIHTAEMVIDVEYEGVQGDINNKIDEAYKEKYKGSPYVSPMVSDRTRAATVRIYPR